MVGDDDRGGPAGQTTAEVEANGPEVVTLAFLHGARRLFLTRLLEPIEVFAT